MGLSCFLMDSGLYLSLLSKGNSTREGEKSWAKVDLLLEEVINICSKKGLDTDWILPYFLSIPRIVRYGGLKNVTGNFWGLFMVLNIHDSKVL